mmetsp:Transcript_66002/g.193118  ORF Transcript_66002/g.193118 Transcript_66002/m.193118 type:complete len:83 (+) Transcript_66002:858-1106(+)
MRACLYRVEQVLQLIPCGSDIRRRACQCLLCVEFGFFCSVIVCGGFVSLIPCSLLTAYFFFPLFFFAFPPFGPSFLTLQILF